MLMYTYNEIPHYIKHVLLFFRITYSSSLPTHPHRHALFPFDVCQCVCACGRYVNHSPKHTHNPTSYANTHAHIRICRLFENRTNSRDIHLLRRVFAITVAHCFTDSPIKVSNAKVLI